MAAEIGPFTPIPHSLAQEVGLVCAAVYGAVWRKCQMEEGACRASLDTLGSDINIDRATVMRSIKKLCELGYLTDQTPGRRNAPHTYVLSKSVAECNSTSVVMRNSPKESVAEENKTVAHNNSSIEGNGETVAESHLKRVSSSFIVSSPKKVSKGESPPAFGPLTQAIARICKIKIRYLRSDTGKELVRIGALLDVDGITPAQVLEFDQWRKAHHWSGKKGNDPPSLKQVGEFWGQYEDWVKRDRPDPPTQPQNGANHGAYQNTNRKGIKALEETGESLRGKPTIDIYTNEYVYPDKHREPIPPVPRVPRRGLLPS